MTATEIVLIGLVAIIGFRLIRLEAQLYKAGVVFMRYMIDMHPAEVEELKREDPSFAKFAKRVLER